MGSAIGEVANVLEWPHSDSIAVLIATTLEGVDKLRPYSNRCTFVLRLWTHLDCVRVRRFLFPCNDSALPSINLTEVTTLNQSTLEEIGQIDVTVFESMHVGSATSREGGVVVEG